MSRQVNAEYKFNKKIVYKRDIIRKCINENNYFSLKIVLNAYKRISFNDISFENNYLLLKLLCSSRIGTKGEEVCKDIIDLVLEFESFDITTSFVKEIINTMKSYKTNTVLVNYFKNKICNESITFKDILECLQRFEGMPKERLLEILKSLPNIDSIFLKFF